MYGGGLDSTALLIHLASKGRPVIVLHVNYGQVAFTLEQGAGEFFCNRYSMEYRTARVDLRLIAPDASIVGGMGGAMMDGRNLVLVSMAAMLASTRNYENVFLGYHKEPEHHPFPDATQQALEAAQVALNAMFARRVSLKAPFAEKTRFEIVQWASRMDEHFMTRTHTCYANVEGGCGECTHCKEKAGFELQLKQRG